MIAANIAKGNFFPRLKNFSSMTRTALIAIGLTCLLTPLALCAQNNTGVKAAEEEAFRRQEMGMLLDVALGKAQAAQKQKEFAAAAKLYEECSLYVKRLGADNVPTQAGQVVNGLTTSRLALAYDAQKRGEFAEASGEADKILKFDPDNKRAVEFKAFNQKVEQAHRGRIPTKPVRAKVAEFANDQAKVGTLLQDAKLLYEMKKYDETEAKLKEAIAIDPQTDTAYYMMRLVQEARFDIEARKRESTYQERIVEVEGMWNKNMRRDLPTPNPVVRTNLIWTGLGRQAILAKLDTMRLPEAVFDSMPLPEVIKYLDEQAKKLDPQKKGINFILNSQLVDLPPGSGGGAAGAPAVDATGAPIVAPAALAGRQDLDGVIIKLSPAVRDLTFSQLLEIITEVADKPIKYSIKDYAVVFTQKLPESAPLVTKIFRVDPNTFIQGLESVSGFTIDTGDSNGGGGGGGGGRGGGGQNQQDGGRGLTVAGVQVANVQQGGRGGGGGGGAQGQAGITGVTTTNKTMNVQALVREFFVACGVNLAPNVTQLFYNDRKGLLWVRASQIDLDIIEQAIEILNVTPPQVMIEARLAEMTQNDSKALGFDWYLGNTLSFDGRIGAQGGTAPSYFGRPSAANPNGVFPGPTAVAPSGAIVPTAATIFPRSTDGSLTGSDVVPGALRQTVGSGASQTFIPEVATITGILTDPQFRTVIRAIEQRDGTDLLAVPRVVTLSGRQTQVQVSDVRTIVTGVQTRQNAGGQQNQNNNNTAGGAVATTINYDTQPVPTGPILDVIPYVCADGYTIQMTLIPSITEFVGYDDPGPFNPQAQSVGAQTVGAPLTATLPLPRFRIRQVVTTCAIWDGQTIALGGLISEDVRNVKDKIPMLGDLPFLGRLFRSESKTTNKKNMVIFVTPTIIDAAGNRVNSDEDLPFIKTATPPQALPKAK